MGTGDFICISMTGGAPWGFRLQGGKEQQQPLQVAKVGSPKMGYHPVLGWERRDKSNLWMVYSSSDSEVSMLARFRCWHWILLGCGWFFFFSPSENLWRVTYSTYVINPSLMGWGKECYIFYQLKKSLVNQLLLWQPARHLGTFLLGSLRIYSCYCFTSLSLALAEEKRSAQYNQLAWLFWGLL